MPRLKPVSYAVLGITFGLLSACTPFASSTGEVQGDTTSLAGLQKMGIPTPLSKAEKPNKKIRYQAIQETALSLGAQSGLAWESKNIDEQLARQEDVLAKIYNFNALILDHNILPPVLLEGRNILNLADTSTIRVADRRYKIARQACFVTTAPNWRQYLWMDYTKPENPSDSLLPKDTTEQQIWDYYTAIGWAEGVKQASVIFSNNVARLKEDFNGMILYRKLLAQNMVSPPFVANTDLGVTGDSGEINIDDRVLRITALPQLDTDSSHWNAIVAKNRQEVMQYDRMEKLATEHSIAISSNASTPPPNQWQPVISYMPENE